MRVDAAGDRLGEASEGGDVIRFPTRFHASVTPGAHLIGEEPNVRDPEPVMQVAVEGASRRVTYLNRERERSYDFTALLAAFH